MNIAIIGSGGDGSGMNMALYCLIKYLKGHNIVLFNRGFQGIIDNNVSKKTFEEIKEARFKGGIVIKSARSSEFMTEKGFNKALNVLKSHNIDVLVVMGGNGSLRGVKELISAGQNCVFIPTTIDNDVDGTDYSIGFDTAIKNAIDFISKVNTSMYSFDRICIYEVMGRHCDELALEIAKGVNATYCYTSKSKKTDLIKAIKEDLKTNDAPLIILQENVVDLNQLEAYVESKFVGKEVKSVIVGYVQRGGDASKLEIKMAKGFAKESAKLIKSKKFNHMISYCNGFIAKEI